MNRHIPYIVLLWIFTGLFSVGNQLMAQDILPLLRKTQKEVNEKKYDKAKSNLQELKKYFNANKTDKSIEFMLQLYVGQKLFFAIHDPEEARELCLQINSSRDGLDQKVDARKSVIAAHSNLLHLSNMDLKPHYAAYYTMEARLYLEKAQSAENIQPLNSEELELLAMAGFNYSPESIERAWGETESRIAQFYNAELYDVLLINGFSDHMDIIRFHVIDFAAKNGSAKASSQAGYYAENGIGCPRSYTSAFRYYVVAADGGDIRGVCYLASCYFWGKGVEQNKPKALELLLRLEGQEDFSKWGGAYLIASFYETGMGVVKDTEKAISYYMEAAEKDESTKINKEAYAQYKRLTAEWETELMNRKHEEKDITKLSGNELRELALDYEHLGNLESAQEFFIQAANKKDAYSCNYMGIQYSSDRNNTQKLKQAAEFFRKGAELGYGPAMYNYARTLFYGEGILPDIDKGKKYAELYFKLVKEDGHHGFQKEELLGFYVGSIYKEKDIIAGAVLYKVYQDIDKISSLCLKAFRDRDNNTPRALYYYERAWSQGSKKAAQGLGSLYLRGTKTLKADYKKAHDYFTQALPDEWAYYGLGEIYEKGWGVPADIGKSLEYYKHAEKNGAEAATKKIKELSRQL